MPQDNDDDWGLDGPDYDHTNYECMECGVFDDAITDDLCEVCYDELKHDHGPDCKHLMGGLWSCGHDDQH